MFPRVIVSLNRARVIASTNSRCFARQHGGTGFASIARGYPRRAVSGRGPPGVWGVGHGVPPSSGACGYPWALLAGPRYEGALTDRTRRVSGIVGVYLISGLSFDW